MQIEKDVSFASLFNPLFNYINRLKLKKLAKLEKQKAKQNDILIVDEVWKDKVLQKENPEKYGKNDLQKLIIKSINELKT